MSNTYNIVFLFLSLLVTTTAFAHAQKEPTVYKLVGTTVEKKPLEIIVKVAEYSPCSNYSLGLRWGFESTIPKTLVSEIQVMVAKQKLFIPFSAYSDLANPVSYYLETGAEIFQLIIKGGDAASSYKAELSFRNGQLWRRKVIHGEFPEEAWEETIYSFNTK